MRTMIRTTILVIAGLVAAQCAMALPVHMSRVGGYYYGDGGEFTAAGTALNANYSASALAAGSGGVGFQTFCLERDEYVTLPGWYDYTIGNAAVDGGVGGPSPDPLSWGTAWLYSQFAAGSLGGYNYGAGRSTSARYLQEAIWWLEHELASYTAGNVFVAAAIAQFGTAAAARADATAGAYNVYALNLTSNRGQTLNQSMLVIRVADGGLTVLMLGVGVMGCAIIRRKLAKVS